MTGGLLSQAELKDTGTFGSFLLAEAGSHRNQAFKEQRQGLMVDSPFHLNIWLAQSGHNLSCPGYITGRLEKWMGLPRTAGGGFPAEPGAVSHISSFTKTQPHR